MNSKIITNSFEETQKVAEGLALDFKESGGVVALTGDLGAGKTTFTQGFAKGLGIKDKIISPTFVLIRQHQVPNTKQILYHLDLYRLEAEDDFKQLGIEDMLQGNNIILIEWAEKALHLLKKPYTQITFKKINDNSREISISVIPA